MGEDADSLRRAIEDIFSDRPHAVHAGNTSSGGKYCSIEVVAKVVSEADRDAKFKQVGAAEGVRVVL